MSEAGTILKPLHTVRTTEECDGVLDWVESALDAKATRIVFFRDLFERINPTKAAQRLIAFKWAGQVTQGEDGTVDSPYLRVLDVRAANMVEEQAVDYGGLAYACRFIESVAKKNIEAEKTKVKQADEAASADVTVDDSNIGKMETKDQDAIKAHDAAVTKARLAAKAAAIRNEIEANEAVLLRAEHLESLVKSTCLSRMQSLQLRLTEQAHLHLRFALRKNNDLKMPYRLPNVLGELPEIDHLLKEAIAKEESYETV